VSELHVHVRELVSVKFFTEDMSGGMRKDVRSGTGETSETASSQTATLRGRKTAERVPFTANVLARRTRRRTQTRTIRKRVQPTARIPGTELFVFHPRY
jgi:hypothetical protein